MRDSAAGARRTVLAAITRGCVEFALQLFHTIHQSFIENLPEET
jgi:hypothetical protein